MPGSPAHAAVLSSGSLAHASDNVAAGLFAEREPDGVHDVQRDFYAHNEPPDVAGIGWNLRVHQHDMQLSAHRKLLAIRPSRSHSRHRHTAPRLPEG